MRDDLIVKDPDILSGIPVFRGTRVPVQNLIDYLVTGETIDSFLDDFPTVKREMVLQFLELAGALVVNQRDGKNTAPKTLSRSWLSLYVKHSR
jgi:uncharacterized protein (DUF433 family)